MTRHMTSEAYCDSYEYHGSTQIEHTRTQAGETVWRDWLIFDTVEEAVRMFREAPRGCPWHYLIGDAAAKNATVLSMIRGRAAMAV